MPQSFATRVAFIVDGKLKALDTPHNLIMQKSAAGIVYTYNENGIEKTGECAINGTSKDTLLNSLILTNKLLTIHSKEQTLGDVFMEITGEETYMRFLNLMKNEFLFAVKYGILILYVIVTAFYVITLSLIPESARHTTGVILIFTDPAAMGLFFMGAVMLLEKSQRVSHAVFVTPVKISEYITAKSMSLLIVGTIAGIIIGIFAKANIVGVIISVVLSSFLFSLCAIIVAVKTESLNSFMLGTIPFETALCLPAILYQFGVIKSDLWVIHPGVAAIALLSDRYNLWTFSIVSLLIWNVTAFIFSHKSVSRYMQHLGGGKI